MAPTDLNLQFKGNLSKNITPKGVAVHYGGGSPWKGADTSTPEAFLASISVEREPTIARGYHAYHLSLDGWAGFAYTSAIGPSGTVYRGRDKGHRTAANGTNAANQNYYAIVYLAGDNDPLTPAAAAAFHREAKRLGVPLNAKHKDFKATACPGPVLSAWADAGFPANAGSAPAPAPAPEKPVPAKPAPAKPPLPAKSAPRYPLPKGWYFGPRSGPRSSVSGFIHRLPGSRKKGHQGLLQWQRRMAGRGWRISADGLYGPQTEKVARQFQDEKGLVVDGLIGLKTWNAAWTEPVT